MNMFPALYTDGYTIVAFAIILHFYLQFYYAFDFSKHKIKSERRRRHQIDDSMVFKVTN
jgi:hypothetical protein